MGYVYLIQDSTNNVYKIGVTRVMDGKRLKKLQTGNSTQLHLLFYYYTQYPFRLETMLHKKYEEYNILNEWYELPEDDVKNFLNTCSDMDEVIKSLKDNPFFNKKLK